MVGNLDTTKRQRQERGHSTLRADGKRTGVTEKFSSVGGVDAAFATNDFSWEYDAAGRLISETADASGGSLFNNYSETFVYDLTGNRVRDKKGTKKVSSTNGTAERLASLVRAFCLLTRANFFENLLKPDEELMFFALNGEIVKALLGSLSSEKPRRVFSWPHMYQIHVFPAAAVLP